MKLNERIIQIREQKSWSQRELARRLGISSPAMTKIEAGEQYPRFELIKQMARVFELTISELMEGVDSDGVPPLPAEFSGQTDSGNRAGISQWCESPASTRCYYNV